MSTYFLIFLLAVLEGPATIWKKVFCAGKASSQHLFNRQSGMRLLRTSVFVRCTPTVFTSLTRRKIHVKSWRVPTVADGTLKVKLGSPCFLRIYVQDPHVHNWEQALIDLHVVKHDRDKADEDVCIEDARSLAETFNPQLKVFYKKAQTTTVLIEAPDSNVEDISLPSYFRNDSRVSMHVGIPGLSNLDISTAGEGEVRIEGAIEGNVRIRTEQANVHVEKVKASVFDAELNKGSLHASVLQATSVIRVDRGSVSIRRAQGPFVKVNSERGDISIDALYTSVADIRSRAGRIALSGSQGTVKVSSELGDVRVEGVEGRLDVESEHGDVHADIAAVAVAHVQAAKGDVSIGLPPPPLCTVLRLSGQQVEIDDSVQLKTKEEEHDQAETNQKEGMKLYLETDHGDNSELSGSEPGHAFVHVNARRGKVSVERREWGMTLRSLWRDAGAGRPSKSQERGDS